MLLCVDSLSTLTGTRQSHGAVCLWMLLSFLVISHCHLPDVPCRMLSSAMVVSWGLVIDHPMRYLQLVGVLEICYPTFGKRAAPAAAKTCNKRPASAAADPISQDEAPWDPKEHDSYLRRLIRDDPLLTEAGIMDTIARDHGVTIARNSTGYYPLQRHLKSIRSTPLTREQLSEYYTVRVQQQMLTGMKGQTLYKWFVQTTSMQCAQSTFSRWQADIPPAAMSSASIPSDCLGDAAFADCEPTLWDIFIAHPFAEAPALAELLEPLVGKVHTPMLETWLGRTRSTQLDLWALHSLYEILSGHRVCFSMRSFPNIKLYSRISWTVFSLGYQVPKG